VARVRWSNQALADLEAIGDFIARDAPSVAQVFVERMDRRFPEEEIMTRRRRTKFIHEGQYAAEVDVELIESQDGWTPYLSLEDAQKLDEVRTALRRGDLRRASQMSRIFKLTPVEG
jgi:plasmid stabilization system protein ParE